MILTGNADGGERCFGGERERERKRVGERERKRKECGISNEDKCDE